MTLVFDSSLVVAALLETDAPGRWADELLAEGDRAAPHLMPVEVVSVLRRRVEHGAVSASEAATAHEQLVALQFELFPYSPFAARVWQLRATVTPYDAWYVALAEAMGAPLATFDLRLARAPGPRCAFEVFDPAT